MNSKLYVPVDDVKSARYKCGQCFLLLREPMQAPCAHFFCRSCLGALVSGKTLKCPKDGMVFNRDEVFPDAYVRNEVKGLVVHCLEFKAGCLWEGKMRDGKEHLASCEFVPVRCGNSGCTDLVARRELQDHQQDRCPRRQVGCSYCGEAVVFCEMEDHQLHPCALYPVMCPSCKVEFPRNSLSQHIAEECPETTSLCPYLAIGCSQKQEMKRLPRKQHEEGTVHFHLSLLFRFVVGLKDEIARVAAEVTPMKDATLVWQKTVDTITQLVAQVGAVAQNSSRTQELVQSLQTKLTSVEVEKNAAVSVAGNPGALQRQLQQLASVVNDLLRKISNVEARDDNHELLLVEANQKVQEQRGENERLERELAASREETRALQREFRALKEALRTGAYATTLPQQPMSCDGILLWKITNVAEKRNEAMNGRQTSLFSPDFYTSPHGYRMSARLYLNGDGMGRGSHVSVFFILKRSEQDALLRWPFQQKVTIMLLDQDNVEHVIDSFNPDPNSGSFQRPRREANIASGCPLFCPVSLLGKQGYIREDTMFIKIMVDCQDL